LATDDRRRFRRRRRRLADAACSVFSKWFAGCPPDFNAIAKLRFKVYAGRYANPRPFDSAFLVSRPSGALTFEPVLKNSLRQLQGKFWTIFQATFVSVVFTSD